MQLPRCKRIDVDEDPGPLFSRGWREIEQLVTYERPPASDGYVPGVRNMEYWEGPAIRGIASISFSDDRLHRDPQVDDDLADRFKVECVEKALAYRALSGESWILTYGQPLTLGFLIFRPDKNVSVLDLMAVLPAERCKGIGTWLVASFLYASQEFRVCRAGTQVHNVGACHLYESLGFREVKRERTFHK